MYMQHKGFSCVVLRGLSIYCTEMPDVTDSILGYSLPVLVICYTTTPNMEGCQNGTLILRTTHFELYAGCVGLNPAPYSGCVNSWRWKSSPVPKLGR